MNSLRKVFLILEHLAAHEHASVTELSRAVNLPAATVHRLLAALVDVGYVAKDTEKRRYQLSTRILRLSGPLLGRLSVRKAAMLHMERLSIKWNETVNLGIVQGDRIVYAETIQSTEPLRIDSPLGERHDPHCSALGKAICANLDQQALDAIIPAGPLPQFTPSTITTRTALCREFAAIRKRGYSVDSEERHPGIRSVAAAIRGQGGEVVGAISVAGPTIRMTDARLPQIAESVVEAVARVSADLGFAGNSRPTNELEIPRARPRAQRARPRPPSA